MDRAVRVDIANQYYSAINRASTRLILFETKEDYGLFESALSEAVKKYDTQLIVYCCMCMPNHFQILSKKEMSLPKNYVAFLEKPLTEVELSAARNSTKKGTPFSDINWRDKIGIDLSYKRPLERKEDRRNAPDSFLSVVK